MDYNPPGSSVHGILQARTLEFVPCLSPGDLPNPGIKLVSPASPALQVDSLAKSSLSDSKKKKSSLCPTSLLMAADFCLPSLFKYLLSYTRDPSL